MASQYAFNDAHWPEVKYINGYAVFMGYLTMGARGLGVLVVTWTTVVLLGGFVSDLEKKDFWCLTGITLVQTAGVFNFFLKEKLSDMVRSWWGLLATTFYAAVEESKKENGRKNIFIRIILVAIQVFVFGVILCALGVLYLLGLYISAGVSLWRLIQHDFGDAGGANQKPALEVLYSLAVAQGVLLCYTTIHVIRGRNRLAKFVANRAMVDKELVAEYLEVAIAGCTKDTSFVKGRNLVTYGMDPMMEAKSSEGFMAGIRAVSLAIRDDSPIGRERKVLAKHLLTRSDSSSHMIKRLLEIVGPRCPYNREVKAHAARIVALVASGIDFQQFPEMIECISSVLDTTSADDEQPAVGNEFHGSERADELLTEAMNIICQLSVDGDNRRILSNTALSKFAMAPLKLHRGNRHDPILDKYWVRWLVIAIGDTNRQSISNIVEQGPPQPPAAPGGGGGIGRSGDEEIQEVEVGHGALGNAAINNLQRTVETIFDCLDCGAAQKMQGIQILLCLSLDMSFTMGTESSKRRLTWILLLIIVSYEDFCSTRSLAHQKLSDMLREKQLELPSSEQSARDEFQRLTRLVLQDLASAFADEDISLKTHATMIMAGLCDECHPYYNLFSNEAKETLAGVMPKVVEEMLTRSRIRREEGQARAPDVENGGLSQDGLDNERRLMKSLVLLFHKYIGCHHCNMRSEFWNIAYKICEQQGQPPAYLYSLLHASAYF